MAGTKAGGKAAAETNKNKYGADFYKNIGSIGGSTKTDKLRGFAAMTREKLIAASSKGGKIGGKAPRRKKS